MERNTDIGATVGVGSTSTTMLTRGQMARALREGVVGEARPGGTGGGVLATAISRVGVRKYINNKDLRIGGGCVTLAMLMAATIAVAPTAGIPRNSANPTSSAPKVAGSIPRTPSPSVGDGNSVHPYVSDVNQGHQKKMLNKITSVAAAVVVGIAATVAGAQSGAVQWKVADGGNGHWYDAIHLEGDVTWYSFKVEAEDRGAHLATVTTSDENQFVFTLSVAKAVWYDGVSGPYLGARKLPNNSFAWVTGEEFNFTNWLPGEPSSGLWEPNLAYLGGSPGSHTPNPYWNDINETTRWAMIEWEADCNNDGIVDYGQCQGGSLPDTNTNNIPDCCEQGINCPVTRLVPTQFPSIQSAIDASANGDRVLVAAGTYHEQVDLRGKGIQLIGVGAESTFIDGDDAHTVIIGSGEPANCVVAGFTIQNGNGSDAGGVSLNGSSARFHHCLFTRNAASSPWGGAGFRSAGGASIVEDCKFIENVGANQSSAAGWYHIGSGAFTLRRCVFEENTGNASGSSGGETGGRVVVVNPEFSLVIGSIEDCVFASQRTGDLTPSFWGSIIVHAAVAAPVRISGCRFIASSGGQTFAIWSEAGSIVEVVNCTGCGFEQAVLIDGNSSGTTTGCSFESTCSDCNNNLIPDAEEILQDPALDSNSDGALDSCVGFDCNGDGINDAQQIAHGQLPDYDSNNIPDCCDRGEACAVGNYPVEWGTTDGGNGHWYMLQRNGSYLCWSTASVLAQGTGGYLASETTEAEHLFISGKLVSRDDAWSGRWGPWIGGVYTSGHWTWTSGEPWGFTAWQPGEPNGAGTETVVSYIALGEGAGCGRSSRWNDWLNCASVQSSGCDVGVWNYIIEWSADCNNDGAVDYGQMLRGELPDINHNGAPDTCECIGDIYLDGVINGADLGALLAYWGPTTSAAPSRACDLNGDGVVNGSDLGILLAYWGACSH